ncbi:MAG: hypothetical protein JWO71_19 [Candidatus Acidoferrum typicum]|nr:hypothetical protein [Candidatus Acidoferrum typicum]
MPTLARLCRAAAQDTCILREVALRECCHYATRTGTCDAQANGILDREHLPIQAFSPKSLSPYGVSTTMRLKIEAVFEHCAEQSEYYDDYNGANIALIIFAVSHAGFVVRV